MIKNQTYVVYFVEDGYLQLKTYACIKIKYFNFNISYIRFPDFTNQYNTYLPFSKLVK